MLFYIPIEKTIDILFPTFYYDFYFLLILFIFILIGIALLIFSVIALVNNRFWTNSQMQTVYECGFLPFEEARVRFEPKFYMVALSFIIFDLEVCFIFPWLLVFQGMHVYYFVIFFVFLFLVLFGIIYEWKSGIFDWNLSVSSSSKEEEIKIN